MTMTMTAGHMSPWRRTASDPPEAEAGALIITTISSTHRVMAVAPAADVATCTRTCVPCSIALVGCEWYWTKATLRLERGIMHQRRLWMCGLCFGERDLGGRQCLQVRWITTCSMKAVWFMVSVETRR